MNRLDPKRYSFFGGGGGLGRVREREKLLAHRLECVRPKSLPQFDLNAQTDRCMTSKHHDLCSNQTHLISQLVRLTAHLRSHLHVHMSSAWKFLIVS